LASDAKADCKGGGVQNGFGDTDLMKESRMNK
jgi:hypothetical protein